MAKTKLVSPNVNTRTLPQTHTQTRTRKQRTAQDISPASLSLNLSLALLLFYFSRFFIVGLQKNTKPAQIGKDLGKYEQEDLYGKQLLANRIE